MPSKQKPQPDPELVRIDELEHLISTGHPRVVLESGADVREIERARVAAEQLASAVCDQLRSEYLARRNRV